MRLKERIDDLWGTANRHPVFVGVVAAIGLVGTYDTFSSNVAQIFGWQLPSLHALFGRGVAAGAHLLPWYAWLILFQFVVASALIWSNYENRHQHRAATAGSEAAKADPAGATAPKLKPLFGLDDDPDDLANDQIRSMAVTIKQIDVDTSELAENLLLRISVLIFGAHGVPLRVEGIRGLFHWRAYGQEAELSQLPTPTPTLDENWFPAFGEGFIHFEQRVTASTAEQMIAALKAQGIEINCEELEIILAERDDPTYRFRLRKWDAILVSQQSRIMTGRIAIARAHLTL